MKSFYIWPLKYHDDSRNPYLKSFENSLSRSFVSMNKCNKNKTWRGVLSLYFNLNSDIIIINWPENIIYKRNGILQVFLYIFFLLLSCFFKVKIVWILHNKNAHKKHFFNKINSFLFFLTAKISKITIVHSKEGLKYYKNKFKRDNVYFLEHPVYGFEKTITSEKKNWDFIIWGKIEPYKNVVEFLEYFKKAPEFEGKKIIICGSCTDKIYLNKLSKLLDERVYFVNKHLSDAKILDYISKTKTILFTYNPISIFCSGSLIFSLETKANIIGPNGGFFKELAMKNMIGVYNHFSEINELASKLVPENFIVDKYIKENTWDNFALRLKKIIIGV